MGSGLGSAVALEVGSGSPDSASSSPADSWSSGSALGVGAGLLIGRANARTGVGLGSELFAAAVSSSPADSRSSVSALGVGARLLMGTAAVAVGSGVGLGAELLWTAMSSSPDVSRSSGSPTPTATGGGAATGFLLMAALESGAAGFLSVVLTGVALERVVAFFAARDHRAAFIGHPSRSWSNQSPSSSSS